MPKPTAQQTPPGRPTLPGGGAVAKEKRRAKWEQPDPRPARVKMASKQDAWIP